MILAHLPMKMKGLIAARSGSPLVIGVGLGEHFIASDASALLPVTRSDDLVDVQYVGRQWAGAFHHNEIVAQGRWREL